MSQTTDCIDTLPTEKEILVLPCRARVALAARCARRAQPLFLASWPEGLTKHAEAIERSIFIVEKVAAEAKALIIFPARDYYEVDRLTERSCTNGGRGASNASFAARRAGAKAADKAASAAHWAALAADNAGASRVVDAIESAASAAASWVNAASRSTSNEGARSSWVQRLFRRVKLADAAAAARTTVGVAFRSDYERLHNAAQAEGWTDETPVPPKFFGPLWPEGAPQGWPREQEQCVPALVIQAEDWYYRVPTEDDLRRLPRWGRVAFGARCARRVQPLFRAAWPGASAEDVEAVELAIFHTESCSADAAERMTGWFQDQAYQTELGAKFAFRDGHATVHAETYAAAAHSCLEAARVERYAAAQHVYAATIAAADAGAAAAVVSDYELVHIVAQAKGWTDDTPVPPEFFGPLWPEGEPANWPRGS